MAIEEAGQVKDMLLCTATPVVRHKQKIGQG